LPFWGIPSLSQGFQTGGSSPKGALEKVGPPKGRVSGLFPHKSPKLEPKTPGGFKVPPVKGNPPPGISGKVPAGEKKKAPKIPFPPKEKPFPQIPPSNFPPPEKARGKSPKGPSFCKETQLGPNYPFFAF